MAEPRNENDVSRKQGGQTVDEVPGVRGPLGPAGAEKDTSGRAGTGPSPDAEPPNWGGEGGAGAHRGGPILSDTEDDAEDEVDAHRRDAGVR
ncbi:hypothetical protein [Chondromyces apiculatus]|nr:hypothetical protein [Chondromyces apiculatus]